MIEPEKWIIDELMMLHDIQFTKNITEPGPNSVDCPACSSCSDGSAGSGKQAASDACLRSQETSNIQQL